MKICCIVCKKEIEKPTINRITCGKKECRQKYRQVNKSSWGVKNKLRVKKYNKEYYFNHKNETRK